jgi:hypothetical protein
MNAPTNEGRCEVTLDEPGVVRLTYFGVPPIPQVRETFATLRDALSRRSPRLLLIDVRHAPPIGGELRAAVQEEAKSLPFDRHALIGIRPVERIFVRIIAKLTGTSDQMGFFDTEAEALRWLREYKGA